MENSGRKDIKDIVAALRRLKVETGSLACLGCGYEQSCGIHGCAILRAAADLLERDGARLAPPNEPLTLEQLREMDGEPAWWDDGDGSCWGIISVDSAGMWGGMPFFRGRWREVNFEYNIEERKMKIYRRPPEGEEGVG